jgi:predicted nucleic acid-binding protein
VFPHLPARIAREASVALPWSKAFDASTHLSLAWREVLPVAKVRQIAPRLFRVHPLRAGDALQPGAAIVGAEDQPASLPFVTLDDRLAQAAERECFTVVRPGRAA